MTRPSRKAPAGESKVHPLPPIDRRHPWERYPRVYRGSAVWKSNCLAATTPPPVRVIRLAGYVIAGGRRDITANICAMYAAENGRRAVELATRGDGSNGLQRDAHRYHAERAAHFARLALGATLEAGR